MKRHTWSARLLLRCLLLTAAFGLTTFALARWQTMGFNWTGIWPLSGPFELHPVHILILGIAMIPPALWEIFLLDADSRRRND
jgi:hypothetical protein